MFLLIVHATMFLFYRILSHFHLYSLHRFRLRPFSPVIVAVLLFLNIECACLSLQQLLYPVATSSRPRGKGVKNRPSAGLFVALGMSTSTDINVGTGKLTCALIKNHYFYTVGISSVLFESSCFSNNNACFFY